MPSPHYRKLVVCRVPLTGHTAKSIISANAGSHFAVCQRVVHGKVSIVHHVRLAKLCRVPPAQHTAKAIVAPSRRASPPSPCCLNICGVPSDRHTANALCSTAASISVPFSAFFLPCVVDHGTRQTSCTAVCPLLCRVSSSWHTTNKTFTVCR